MCLEDGGCGGALGLNPPMDAVVVESSSSSTRDRTGDTGFKFGRLEGRAVKGNVGTGLLFESYLKKRKESTLA